MFLMKALGMNVSHEHRYVSSGVAMRKRGNMGKYGITRNFILSAITFSVGSDLKK